MVPACGAVEARDAAQDRGLARARRPEQRQHLARREVHLEGGADGRAAPVPPLDVDRQPPTGHSILRRATVYMTASTRKDATSSGSARAAALS